MIAAARRRGVLVVEVGATGFIFDGGHLRAAAWLYRGALGMWAEGEEPPEALRMAALHAAVAVGYDLHALIGPHVSRRFGIHLHWPRIDMRTATGRTPAELAARFPLQTNLICLPSDPELAGVVRRLLVVDSAWRWLRSHR